MALTELQKRIMQRLPLNRSPSSYLAGGLILNLNWPRRSDDIDIFHDTDEEVSGVAEKDIADLENAASSRRKARDFADIVAISANMCSIGPLVMAAAGKPPAYSPQKIIEQIRWHAETIPDEEYAAVKGLPADWTPPFIRTEVTRQMALAETYIMRAPVAAVGVLSVGADGTPVEITNETIKTAVLRKATEEPDVMPMPADFSTTPWSGC